MVKALDSGFPFREYSEVFDSLFRGTQTFVYDDRLLELHLI